MSGRPCAMCGEFVYPKWTYCPMCGIEINLGCMIKVQIDAAKDDILRRVENLIRSI